MDFNKKLFIDNIYFMLKQKEMKIGEFETLAGVSPGYLSRIRDDSTKPGIDFICKTADVLSTNIDNLLNRDLSLTAPTVNYLSEFLSKILKELVEESLDYDARDSSYFRSLKQYRDGKTDHPLIRWQTEEIMEQKYDYNYFPSHTYGNSTSIFGICYELYINSKLTLYIMNVAKDYPIDYSEAVEDHPVLEIWAYSPSKEPIFLCYDQDNNLSPQIRKIYDILQASANRPRIKTEYKSLLDEFLYGNTQSDAILTDEGELPF